MHHQLAQKVLTAKLQTHLRKKKDKFYEELQGSLKNRVSRNNLLIVGDFNAKAIQATTQEEEQVIGKHAFRGGKIPDDLGESAQDNRHRLMEFCVEHELRLMNTMFDKPEHK